MSPVFRLLALSSLAVVLAGCASSDDLRKKDPVFFASTQQTPGEYTECVARRWRQLGANVEIQPIRNGVDLLVRGRFNVEETLRAQHYDGKTNVDMYTRTPYRFQRYVEAANLCL